MPTESPKSENEIIREYVVKIAVSLGLALSAAIGAGCGQNRDVAGYWEGLGNDICDFTEYLDG